MHFLRIAAPDTVGIFRKSGVRSRITELRMLCDVAPEAEVFTDGKLDLSQVFISEGFLRKLNEQQLIKYLVSLWVNPSIEPKKNFSFIFFCGINLERNRNNFFISIGIILFYAHSLSYHLRSMI